MADPRLSSSGPGRQPRRSNIETPDGDHRSWNALRDGQSPWRTGMEEYPQLLAAVLADLRSVAFLVVTGRLDGQVLLVIGGGVDGPSRADEYPWEMGGLRPSSAPGEGLRWWVADRDLNRAEETVALIRTEGHEALAVACDAGEERELQRAADTTQAAFGHLTLLVNNVGVGAAHRSSTPTPTRGTSSTV